MVNMIQIIADKVTENLELYFKLPKYQRLIYRDFKRRH